MTQFVVIGDASGKPETACAPPQPRTRVYWLQGITLAWMLVEFGVSAYAALTAHSPALLAFSSDSLVELLSAVVVLLQWIPGVCIAENRAARMAGVLLFVLAFIVTGAALGSLFLKLRPESSESGIAITLAALVAMPILAGLKRKEARRSGNVALAADAAQSATCAYLALLTLLGLAAHAILRIAWFDAAAALVAVPLLWKEGRAAWKGKVCGCC